MEELEKQEDVGVDSQEPSGCEKDDDGYVEEDGVESTLVIMKLREMSRRRKVSTALFVSPK